MGNELIAAYRLVYFQPDPEDGERVCVALLFNTKRDVELLYDRHFPKLRCLAPHIDPDLVRIYLEDMEAACKRAPSDVDSLIRQHAPQLVTSDVRKSAWPLTDEARLYLMERFLAKEKHSELAAQHAQKDDLVKAHLRQLVQKASKEGPANIREDANSNWVLGTRVSKVSNIIGIIGPVALAVRRTAGVILIDGIDLSVSTPNHALRRAGRVTHTFWQYGRIQQLGIDDRIRRIGIVLNGLPNPGPDYKDVHDFAFDQFKKEADLAIDGSSISDLERLEEELHA